MRTPLLLPILLLLGACSSLPLHRTDADALLRAQAQRWNQGDLAGFVDTYHDGAELTFLGAGGITRGRAQLLAMYQRAYPDAATRGQLQLELLDFTPLGETDALALGHYRLERPGKDAEQGWFSLVLQRQDGRIRVLHDHTTAAAPPAK